MNGETQHLGPPIRTFLFDWAADVERLEREANAAEHTQQPNDFALIDAECSLDLIDSDLSAARQGDAKANADIVRQLTEWRTRVANVAKRLRGLSA